MSKKTLLNGPVTAPAIPPHPATGAAGQTITHLRVTAIQSIDPFLIDGAGLADRIENDETQDAALARSIAEYGQQVPVLLRPHPQTQGRYQIVYGRRRVLALRDLGLPARAMIRDLDDRALLLAQGQENNARRNLSFIEKVNFARQMNEAGYDRKVICDALSIDKSTASRMLAVAVLVPPLLIASIGAAPNVGRDRWVALAETMADHDIPVEDVMAMVALTPELGNSDARFETAIRYLATCTNRRLGQIPPQDIPIPAALEPPKGSNAIPRKRPLRGHDGIKIGQVLFGARSMTIRLEKAASRGFDRWLLTNLTDLHRRWDYAILPAEDDAGKGG
jgi:ParB family chromosome partitioning protein